MTTAPCRLRWVPFLQVQHSRTIVRACGGRIQRWCVDEDNEEGDDAIRLDSSDTNITTRARYDSPLASLEIIVSKWERQQENLSLPRCRDARAYIYFAANSSFAA